MMWRKVFSLALVALALASSPAYAGKKHAKAPPKNGGIYVAPAPSDNPGRITMVSPPKLSTDPGSPFAPSPLAAQKAEPDLDPAPEPKHFAISDMSVTSLFR